MRRRRALGLQEGGRPPLLVGRYNSVAPVSGLTDAPNKRQELKRRLNEMDVQWARARASARAREDSRILEYFQAPDGCEMWSRWDMQEAPPDILITNYSMLNIMLMRNIEDNIFESTKRWLAADRQHHLFHLVVDELHTYRATPGTEVGYLLRTLLQRLDLHPDSPQLRIIATSASIEEDPESRRYLEGFFGRDRSSFDVLPGDRRRFRPPERQFTVYADQFAALDRALDDRTPAEAAATFATGLEETSSGDPGRDLAHSLERIGALEAVRRRGEGGRLDSRTSQRNSLMEPRTGCPPLGADS